jgi:FtsP/CotA-like multicopper oxidase with cupredoxin domain
MSQPTVTRTRLAALLVTSVIGLPFTFCRTAPAPAPLPVSAAVSDPAPVAAPPPAVPAPAPAPPPIVAAAAVTPFANPAEVSAKNNLLRAVMLMADDDRTVPGGGTKHLRYFQGWDFDNPAVKAPASVKAFSPGPTLRARVGDKVEILFLNKVNDDNFAYTFVTAKGQTNPAYGCDGASNLAVYPATDTFPNCFHGSSTANLHFHGMHVTPDALGDNVLMQVMPDRGVTQDAWKMEAQEIFDRAQPATKWEELPFEYRKRQKILVTKVDASLWAANEQQIGLHQFPQYVVGAFTNVFEIPNYDDPEHHYDAGQAPGTQWYHAHKHGSTALHTLNGLAGLFIIEGHYDDFIRDFYHLNNTYGAFEKLFVLQFINPDLDLERTSPQGPATTLVNGLSQPTIQMKAGEVQLWRFVNATVGSLGNGTIGPGTFQGSGFRFLQTAQDGVQFSRDNFIAQPNIPEHPDLAHPVTLTLAGGNRADLLVRAPLVGGTTQFSNAGNVLFNVTVTAPPSGTKAVNMPLPCEKTPAPDCWPAMPKFLDDLPAPKGVPHPVAFGWEANRTAAGRVTSKDGIKLPPKFTIDNKQFDDSAPHVDQCMPLGATQDWLLKNDTTTPHPYHIHINPFQVVKIEAPFIDDEGAVKYKTTAPTTNLLWQDVVAIPAGVLSNGVIAQGRVTIRQHYADFTGTFVLHCHILAHEDRGMMQLVRIVPADKFPGACQQAIPHHH